MFGKSLSLGGRRRGGISVFQFSFPLHPAPHALARLRLFHPFSLTGLEVDGMLLDLFNNGFLLDSPLETPKRAF